MDENTQRLIDLIRPITSEAFERLQVDLDDADSSAVATAITKAALAGFRAGVASLTGVQEVGGLQVRIEPEIHDAHPDYDGWAEEYGTNDDDP